ncbi:MAG: shikimate dehydrogenase, partial [Rhodospirillaceae bacterium]
MGWPVAHSKSPAVHGYWLKHYNLAGEYQRLPVEPDDLGRALKSLAEDGFVGVNLTVPHKKTALEWIDDVSDTARRIGAVNTVIVGSDGGLRATNTDAYGFMTNLQNGAPDFDAAAGPAVVL